VFLERLLDLDQLQIAGGFCSKDGAKDFEGIRLVLSTARKQGWNILGTLIADPDRLFAQLGVAGSDHDTWAVTIMC